MPRSAHGDDADGVHSLTPLTASALGFAAFGGQLQDERQEVDDVLAVQSHVDRSGAMAIERRLDRRRT